MWSGSKILVPNGVNSSGFFVMILYILARIKIKEIYEFIPFVTRS